jgi:Base plate wedge protein 53
MTSYFTSYPTIKYNIENRKNSYELTVKDIFFRVNIIKDVISNIGTYYYHSIEDTDTPEILAYKIYKNTELHWIILYANDMLDPIADWPKDYNTFNKYIISKYGSLTAAQTTTHHYEMLISRENVNAQVTDETRFTVTYEKLTNNNLDVPFDYYQGTGSLEDTQGVTTYTVDGKTVIETIQRESISNYDWELAQNDARRTIKIIKPNYVPQIFNEFKRLSSPYKKDNMARFV